MKELSSFRLWLPRVLSILFVLFLMLFSLDVFDSSASVGEIAIGLLVHNIPALALAAVVAVSWKYEIVGGITFILAGIAYAILMLANGSFGTNVWLPLAIISAPAFLIGVLFTLNWIQRKNRN